jgi:putative membrane protein
MVMPEEKNPFLQPNNTDLAFERAVLAHERTLMVWVGTAISKISFGFTIYKFFPEFNTARDSEQRPLRSRVAGMVMILFELVALGLVQVQHGIAMKRIRQYYPAAPGSLSSIMVTLVLVFGFALFLVGLFRQ